MPHPLPPYRVTTSFCTLTLFLQEIEARLDLLETRGRRAWAPTGLCSGRLPGHVGGNRGNWAGPTSFSARVEPKTNFQPMARYFHPDPCLDVPDQVGQDGAWDDQVRRWRVRDWVCGGHADEFSGAGVCAAGADGELARVGFVLERRDDVRDCCGGFVVEACLCAE